MLSKKVYAAIGVLVMSMVMACFGIDTWIKEIGFLAAGFLFGSATIKK